MRGGVVEGWFGGLKMCENDIIAIYDESWLIKVLNTKVVDHVRIYEVYRGHLKTTSNFPGKRCEKSFCFVLFLFVLYFHFPKNNLLS